MKYLGNPITLRGHYRIRHEKANGDVEEAWIHNTVTNVGKDSVAGAINNLKTEGFTVLAIGTSETEAALTQTALKAEIAAGSLARATATATQHTTDVTNDTAVLTHTFTATASYTVKEAGIFDQSTASAGVLLARGTFSGKAMEANDTLTVYYYIDVD